ncbi:MAG: RES domain-containing protein [Chloroflexi bacterium]|nr:RES domain-containing protein [Chloroflexota bacterium]
MAPHPEPPADLAAHVSGLPLRRVRPGTQWWRIHRLEYAPLYFGRSRRYRFDDPEGECGVLYVGADPLCAFVETLGHNTGVNIISRKDLGRRGWA